MTDDGMYYLLLDEVQKLGSFESVLNGYLRKKNMDVYVTGSNSKFLSSDIITEFEGRGDEIHVLPLSFSEFYSAYNGSKDEAFDDYMVYGGLPAVALMNWFPKHGKSNDTFRDDVKAFLTKPIADLQQSMISFESLLQDVFLRTRNCGLRSWKRINTANGL